MRERPCAAPAVSASLGVLLDGHRWHRDLVGESGGAVYRLEGPRALFLKHGAGRFADDVFDEAARLLWLAGRLSVPEVVHVERSGAECWLLMTAMPGRTAYQVLEDAATDRHAAVRAIARFLRRMHALPVEDCPFVADAAHRLRQARARIDAGLVATDEFDAEREGWTAEQVWDAMTALLPLAPDPVVTHGDYSLDNILMEAGEVTGLIDAGRVGIADRYQDLAILWNCLDEFDVDLRDTFFEEYGVAAPDARKLQFHLMLDECF